MGNTQFLQAKALDLSKQPGCHALENDYVIYNAGNDSCNSLYEVLVIVLGTLSGLYTIFFIALLVYWCARKKPDDQDSRTTPAGSPQEHRNDAYDNQEGGTYPHVRSGQPSNVPASPRGRDVDLGGYVGQYEEQEPYPPYPAAAPKGSRPRSAYPQQSAYRPNPAPDSRRRVTDDDYKDDYARGRGEGYRGDYQGEAYAGGRRYP